MRKSRAQREEEAAEDYAAMIRDGIRHDWAAWNAILIEEFSLTALARIKRRAWQIVENPDER